MTTFDPLVRPEAFGKSLIPAVHQTISNWLNAKPFQDLINEFSWSDQSDQENNLLSRLNILVKQSDEWDYRKRTAQLEKSGVNTKEGTRWTSTDKFLSESQKKLAIEAAKYFQLSSASIPLQHQYRSILVLGGGRLSCQLRTRYAIEQLKNTIKARDFALLGSERLVAPSERKATDTYAPEAKTEFDLFVSALELELDEKPILLTKNRYANSNPNLTWEIRKYKSTLVENTIVISAPSSDPKKRRANSVDTYMHYFKNFPFTRGDRILLVTSYIYVPYQQLEALRVLGVPKDVYVETIGFPPEWGGRLHGMQDPQHYLQEIRSFLQSAQRFVKTYSY